MTWEEYQKELGKVGFSATIDDNNIVTVYDKSKNPFMNIWLLDDQGVKMLSNFSDSIDLDVMTKVLSASNELVRTPYEEIHISPIYKLVWDSSTVDPIVLGYNVRRRIWKLDYDTNLQRAGFQTMFTSDALDKIAGDNADLTYRMNALKEKI